MKLDDKRVIREHKRKVKRLGHKRKRAQLREALRQDPESLSARDDAEFGMMTSAHIHADATGDDT